MRDWPLVGRSEEMAVAWEAIRRGPGSVVVAGVAGVGKTRLAREILARAAAGGAETRWAIATATASSIPFGAVAHLLPEPSAVRAQQAAFIRLAVRTLIDGAAGRPLVVVIDDAHWLDKQSATLVHQLALGGEASLVVSVRSGHPAPDAITVLWKDGLAERLELQALSRPALEQLVGDVLAGPLDGPTMERLWSMSQGNALYLRELLEVIRDTHQLRRVAGVWRWDGHFAPGARLVEIIEDRLAQLTPAERTLVELLAFEEPLGVARVTQLCDPQSIVALERKRLVVVEHSRRRIGARLAHPLYAETLRSSTPSMRALQLRRLVDGASPLPLRRRGDVIRQAVLRLETGTQDQADADLLGAAARKANSLTDHVLAERLARARLAIGPHFSTGLALVEALSWQGRLAEAEEIGSGLATLAETDADRGRLALLRAGDLFWGMGRGNDAGTVLDDAACAMTEEAGRYDLAGLRTCFAFFAGRPLAAIALGATVLAASDASNQATLWASAGTAVALAVCGREADAVGLTEEGFKTLEGYQDQMAIPVRCALTFSQIRALRFAGRLNEAAASAARLYSESLANPSSIQYAAAAMLSGQVALDRGCPRAAIRWLTEARSRFLDYDPAGYLHQVLLALAEAHSLLRQVGDADQSLDAAAAARNPAIAVWVPDWLMAQAWVASARGETSRSLGLSNDAADEAARMRQSAVEGVARHQAIRLGLSPSHAVRRLGELAAEVDGELVTAFFEHAVAAAAGDGERLDRVGARFGGMGATLLAADATAHAAAAHQRAGKRSRSVASAARAQYLADLCEGATTPALASTARALPLTRREWEVAALAARGMPNQAIADLLVVSVRTVEGHLAQTYAKLAITSRATLAEMLAGRQAL